MRMLFTHDVAVRWNTIGEISSGQSIRRSLLEFTRICGRPESLIALKGQCFISPRERCARTPTHDLLSLRCFTRCQSAVKDTQLADFSYLSPLEPSEGSTEAVLIILPI